MRNAILEVQPNGCSVLQETSTTDSHPPARSHQYIGIISKLALFLFLRRLLTEEERGGGGVSLPQAGAVRRFRELRVVCYSFFEHRHEGEVCAYVRVGWQAPLGWIGFHSDNA